MKKQNFSLRTEPHSKISVKHPCHKAYSNWLSEIIVVSITPISFFGPLTVLCSPRNRYNRFTSSGPSALFGSNVPSFRICTPSANAFVRSSQALTSSSTCAQPPYILSADCSPVLSVTILSKSALVLIVSDALNSKNSSCSISVFRK